MSVAVGAGVAVGTGVATSTGVAVGTGPAAGTGVAPSAATVEFKASPGTGVCTAGEIDEAGAAAVGTVRGLVVAVGTGIRKMVRTRGRAGTGVGVAVGTGVLVGAGSGVAVGTGLGASVAVGTGLDVGVGVAIATGIGVARRLGSPIAGQVAVSTGVGSGWLQPTAMLIMRLAMPIVRSFITANSLWFIMQIRHAPGKIAWQYVKYSLPPGVLQEGPCSKCDGRLRGNIARSCNIARSYRRRATYKLG